MLTTSREASAAIISRRFHSTLVELVAKTCDSLREQTALDRVVLSGEVFMNAPLTREVGSRLSSDGFHLFRPTTAA